MGTSPGTINTAIDHNNHFNTLKGGVWHSLWCLGFGYSFPPNLQFIPLKKNIIPRSIKLFPFERLNQTSRHAYSPASSQTIKAFLNTLSQRPLVDSKTFNSPLTSSRGTWVPIRPRGYKHTFQLQAYNTTDCIHSGLILQYQYPLLPCKLGLLRSAFLIANIGNVPVSDDISYTGLGIGPSSEENSMPGVYEFQAKNIATNKCLVSRNNIIGLEKCVDNPRIGDKRNLYQVWVAIDVDWLNIYENSTFSN